MPPPSQPMASAHGEQARPVRFLEVSQADGRTQPNNGPKRRIDPELWRHRQILAVTPFLLRLDQHRDEVRQVHHSVAHAIRV